MPKIWCRRPICAAAPDHFANVTLWADGGGKTRKALLRPLEGREAVAHMSLASKTDLAGARTGRVQGSQRVAGTDRTRSGTSLVLDRRSERSAQAWSACTIPIKERIGRSPGKTGKRKERRFPPDLVNGMGVHRQTFMRSIEI